MDTVGVAATLPRRSRGGDWLRLLVLLVGLDAAAGGVSLGRADGSLSWHEARPGVGFSVFLAPAGCVPVPTHAPAVAALDAGVACHDAALAARARALEFDPVR